MPSIVVDQIEAPEATIASFRDPAREETLVAAARNGNEQAFEILVTRHEQRILGVAQRYTRAQEDAKDIVQQTFQNAFVHLHSFEWKSSFSTWLTRIAINEALQLRSISHIYGRLTITPAPSLFLRIFPFPPHHAVQGFICETHIQARHLRRTSKRTRHL